jgi:hypothetical protein
MLHDVWANQAGKVAYLSYWDAGLILLDISDPSRPLFLGRGNYLSDDGNTHSAVPAQGGNLVIVGDEVLAGAPFGFMRVFDTMDERNPVEVGRFHTEHTFGGPADFGWYSDGLRLLDISVPAAPREIAFFVPPDVRDPRGWFSPKARIWGIYVQDDLILASDVNAGLYILGRQRLGISPRRPESHLRLDSD